MTTTTPTLFDVSDGLATLGPEALAVVDAVEDLISRWAARRRAQAMSFPPLLRVEDLDRFDYFDNFPHLALMTARIRPSGIANYAQGRVPAGTIPQSDLCDTRFALPSAACYGIYSHLAGSRLEAPRFITTVAQCFRNEKSHSGLSRLWGFRMREIVCLGSADAVQGFLAEMKDTVAEFALRIDLPLLLEAAADPFYDPNGRRALMQRLAPVKHEFVYGDGIAVASANFHRNFFGERCRIRTGDGQPAFSGCVAFGIERWLHALCDRFGGDTERIVQLLKGCTA